MSFPRYPSYKDSGVEWLGEVPEHWEVKSLGYLCVKIGSGKTPSGGAETYTDDGIVFIRSQNVYNEGLSLDDVVYITTETDEELRASRVREGDILLNITGASIGRTCIVPVGQRQANVNQHVCIIRLEDSRLCGFVEFTMKSLLVKGQIDQAQTGAAREGLNFSQISKLVLTIPPLLEQAHIAEFLCHETAKIDALVAEQQRLIELLKEKRQAVISHAVTKGLNPDAPMKASGVEWLGEVPEHWTAKPLKYIAAIGNGSTPSRENPEYWAESGFPWLNSSVVNTPLVTEAEGFVTEQALQECHLPIVAPPAVLVGITGQGRTRGMAAMLGIEATINQHVAYVKPNTTNLNVDYLLRVLEMSYLKLRQDSEEAGATKGAITCGQIGNLSIPFPPVSEQAAIALFLSDRTAKFDTLTAEAQRAIELLQERRSALISAAVTGQIDVRHLAEGVPA